MGTELDEFNTRCSFCKSLPGNKDKYSRTTSGIRIEVMQILALWRLPGTCANRLNRRCSGRLLACAVGPIPAVDSANRP